MKGWAWVSVLWFAGGAGCAPSMTSQPPVVAAPATAEAELARAHPSAVAPPAPSGAAQPAISDAAPRRDHDAVREPNGSTADFALEDPPTAIVDHGSYRPSAAHAPAPSAAPAAAPSAPPTSGTVSDAAQKVGAMRPDFRTCYQRGLKADRDLQGKVRITIRVGPNGHVVEATAKSDGLPSDVVDCVLKRASSTVFSPPEGGSAVIAVPVTFVKQ